MSHFRFGFYRLYIYLNIVSNDCEWNRNTYTWITYTFAIPISTSFWQYDVWCVHLIGTAFLLLHWAVFHWIQQWRKNGIYTFHEYFTKRIFEMYMHLLRTCRCSSNPNCSFHFAFNEMKNPFFCDCGGVHFVNIFFFLVQRVKWFFFCYIIYSSMYSVSIHTSLSLVFPLSKKSLCTNNWHGERSDIWQIHHSRIATQIHNFNLHFKHFSDQIHSFSSMKIMVSCHFIMLSLVKFTGLKIKMHKLEQVFSPLLLFKWECHQCLDGNVSFIHLICCGSLSIWNRSIEEMEKKNPYKVA